MLNCCSHFIFFLIYIIWLHQIINIKKKKIQSAKTRPRADCGSNHEQDPYCQIQTEIEESRENH